MKTKQILKAMNILSWIRFLGLCIKTGALIISFLFKRAVDIQSENELTI